MTTGESHGCGCNSNGFLVVIVLFILLAIIFSSVWF